LFGIDKPPIYQFQEVEMPADFNTPEMRSLSNEKLANDRKTRILNSIERARLQSMVKET